MPLLAAASLTIAIAPTNNNVVYVAMSDNGSLYGYGRMAGIYRADDGINFVPVLDWSHEFSPWLVEIALE